MSGSMRRLLFALVVLFLLGLVGVAGFGLWLDRSASTPVDPAAINQRVEFKVEKGRTLNQLGTELEAAQLINSAFVWRVYVKLHRPEPPKAGRHAVSAGMTMPEILGIL